MARYDFEILVDVHRNRHRCDDSSYRGERAVFEGKDQSVIARLIDVDDYKEVPTTLNWYLVNVFFVENGTFNRKAKTSLSFHQDNLMILRFFFAMWMLWKIMIIQRFGTQPVAAKLSSFFLSHENHSNGTNRLGEKQTKLHTKKTVKKNGQAPRQLFLMHFYDYLLEKSEELWISVNDNGMPVALRRWQGKRWAILLGTSGNSFIEVDSTTL